MSGAAPVLVVDDDAPTRAFVADVLERFGPSLPIVFLSGERVESYDRAVGLLIGGDDYLLKPVSQDVLLARIRTLTARREHDVPLTRREREVISLLADGL